MDRRVFFKALTALAVGARAEVPVINRPRVVHYRPQEFQINRSHPLARGLVGVGYGWTDYYACRIRFFPIISGEHSHA